MRIDEIFGGPSIATRSAAGLRSGIAKGLDALQNKTTRKWAASALNSPTGQAQIIKRIQKQMWQDWNKNTGGGNVTWQRMADYISDTYGPEAFESLSKEWPQLVGGARGGATPTYTKDSLSGKKNA